MKYLCQVFCSFILIVLTARAGVAAVSSCSEMRPCTTDAGATGICANSVCVDRIEPETRHGLAFVITAKYPVDTLQVGKIKSDDISVGNNICFNTKRAA